MQVNEGYAFADYLSVGDVAALLGVAPATVRSWGRRYGIVAATRTEGGHRRYAPSEVAVLRVMQDLVGSGLSPAEAARQALMGGGAATVGGFVDDAMPLRGARGGPGGRVLAVPGASPEARGLARSVTRLDAEATSGQISDLLVRRGAEATWSEVLVPVLRAVGHRWERTGAGVEIEHVLSEALIDAIRGYCAFLPTPAPGRPVLLASAPEEAHTLPLHILRAALTERRVGSLMVGGRVPIEALSAAARRTGARRVFIWRQTAPFYPTMGPGLADNPPDPGAAGLLPDQMAAAAVLGGDGWAGVTVPASARWVPDLTGAIRELTV